MNNRRKILKTAVPAAAAALAAGTLMAAMSGSANAAGVGAPEVFAGFRDSKPMVGMNTASSALQLPIGTYTINAKVTLFNNNGVQHKVTCRLDATTDFDESEASLSLTTQAQTVALQVTKVANSPKLIFLNCRSNSPSANVTLKFAKITAIRVADPAHLHNSPLV